MLEMKKRGWLVFNQLFGKNIKLFKVINIDLYYFNIINYGTNNSNLRRNKRYPNWKRSKIVIVCRFSSVQSLSCVWLFVTPWIAESGLLIHHQLLEFTQTHAHRVGDAIQPSHPLSSPSPPAPNPSQHQGLFQWVNSLHVVAKVLEFQLQHQSFQWWTPRTDLL